MENGTIKTAQQVRSFDENCVFCKILQGKISSKKVLETEFSLAIQDISPKAPIHFLIIPKIHVQDLNFVTPENFHILADVIVVAKELAEKYLAGSKAFNLILNNGQDAGQSVLHTHWHFLAGKNIYDGGFKL